MKHPIISNKVVTKPLPFLLLLGFFFVSCESDDDGTNQKVVQFGIFKVLDQSTIELDGVINSASLTNFNELIAEYPDINTINMVNCDGSSDDEVNLELSALVHQRNIDIHINEGGVIASGGTDFFLAGIHRTRGVNTQIGVHSWGGEDDDGNEVMATDFPEGHEYHLPYINYYVSVGFTQQQAEDFYYFTINAASAFDIHWMTDEEIARYGLVTN